MPSSSCCSWYGSTRCWLLGIKEYLLPPPSTIWTEFLKRCDTVLQGAWVTTQEILGGYLLAVVVSIPIALAVARSRFVEETRSIR